jgi:ribosomal biogenesis protein LAS1
MRRSPVNEARRRQSVAERRFRGHRIRGGLDELGDLDAPKPQKPRHESFVATTASAAPAAAAAIKDDATGAAKVDGSLLSSSSSAVSATVFGVDWSEWIAVKRVLFDMEAAVDAKRAALEKIRVWHLRTRKERSLPPAVEATEVLLDAMLQDEADTLADGPLRMCYGAALSRAVHIMTGSFASGSADTYRKRARAIGFPEEAVEVRQRVAHGALPLTSELRWVCGLVLQFVFTEYWLEQERQLHLMQVVDKTPVVLGGNTDAVSSRGGGKGKKPTAAAKQISTPLSSAPPPSVSVEDMKALLADLEDDSEGDVAADKTASPAEKSRRVSGEAAVQLKGDVTMGWRVGGWLLS